MEKEDAPLPSRAATAQPAERDPLAGTLLATQSDKPASLSRTPAAAPRGQGFIWTLAALIVIVCVVLLLKLY